MTHWPWSL